MSRNALLPVAIGLVVASSPLRAQSGGPEYILHIIPPFGTGTLNEAVAYDVNSSGQVVGQSMGSVTTGFIGSSGTGAVEVFPGGVTIAEDGTYAVGDGVYDETGTLLWTIPPVSTTFTAIRPDDMRSGPGFIDGPVVFGRAFDPPVPAPGRSRGSGHLPRAPRGRPRQLAGNSLRRRPRILGAGRWHPVRMCCPAATATEPLPGFRVFIHGGSPDTGLWCRVIPKG